MSITAIPRSSHAATSDCQSSAVPNRGAGSTGSRTGTPANPSGYTCHMIVVGSHALVSL
ncbi:hypothetical protein QVC92_06335 [Corynebacterium diphtheriae]|nr:hypothetical protein [Corynebacterium diphtheriae]MDZ5308991.1 hypothetical protein [Corynebacterium diphtheriae]